MPLGHPALPFTHPVIPALAAALSLHYMSFFLGGLHCLAVTFCKQTLSNAEVRLVGISQRKLMPATWQNPRQPWDVAHLGLKHTSPLTFWLAYQVHHLTLVV